MAFPARERALGMGIFNSGTSIDLESHASAELRLSVDSRSCRTTFPPCTTTTGRV